jgi:phosphatidylglycerophosphate synthase
MRSRKCLTQGCLSTASSLGRITGYIEPSDTATGITLFSFPNTLPREARSLCARSLGFAVAVTPLPVLGGAVGAVPALTGVALFAGFLLAISRGLLAYHPHPRLGIANRITLARAAIACLIAARAIEPAPLGEPERWLLSAVAGAALLLDGADGWAARRQGLASAFGARFDLEVDAFAILVLSITVVKAHAVPPWVLAIGAMRYLYLAMALVLPLLRRPLPPRPIADRRRKTIAVVQSVGLIVAMAPATSSAWAQAACAVALGLLAYSFGTDIFILRCTTDRIGEVE